MPNLKINVLGKRVEQAWTNVWLFLFFEPNKLDLDFKTQKLKHKFKKNFKMSSQIFFQLLSLFLVVTAGPLVIFLLVFNDSKL